MSWYNELGWIAGPLGAAATGASGGGAVKNFLFGNGQAQDTANNLVKNNSQYAFVGGNPYQGGWDSLIGQLQQQSQGNAGSLAQSQYNAAHQDALSAQIAMSRGRGRGAARQGMNNMGRIGQGLAQGAGQLRLQEQLAAQQGLMQAYNNAGQADFNRAQSNQAAYMGLLGNQLGQPSQAQQFMGMAAQGLGAAASMG